MSWLKDNMWKIIGGATGGAIGGVGGAGIGMGIGGSMDSGGGQSQANQFNAQQATQQMEFQERMSNTSYRRNLADLKGAGLNPMLAISQGVASAPSGAMATAQSEAPEKTKRAETLINAAMMGKRLHQESKTVDANVGLAEASEETERTKQQMNLNTAANAKAALPGIKAEAILRKKQYEQKGKHIKKDDWLDRAKGASSIWSDIIPKLHGGTGKGMQKIPTVKQQKMQYY